MIKEEWYNGGGNEELEKRTKEMWGGQYWKGKEKEKERYFSM
jgi:hypothetical protein